MSQYDSIRDHLPFASLDFPFSLSNMANKHVAVIAGDIADALACYRSWFRIWNTARLFAKEGYAISLAACSANSLKALTNEVNAASGTASPFPISSYSTTDINTAYA
ncbi:hypothetical protein ARMGADRAFT_1090268 [Armillaria gallica]|uniref:Uncharacterized protein n=1 Tax=Armillaria gallica TaxID=47427 RepID=A0A2H3CHI8_ARMGA|nr:hypothetical protein ARMGADRAFT_1090268 [Armillaria gallica]